jgi:putative transposase
MANELQRDFTETGPNQTWVADITYIPTTRGFIYLAVVLDVWSRAIVGYSICSHLRTDGVLGALHMAIAKRKPSWGELRHHSDRGCQYTSKEFRTHCRNAGIVRSMSAPGTPYDNAMCESFFATLKSELTHEQTFTHLEQAAPIIQDYISNYYNKDRRHSSLGFLSPSQFELSMASNLN